MSDGYSWSESRGGGGYRLPGPDRVGWWAAVAMLLSILLHVVVFFALERLEILPRPARSEDYSTGPVNIQQLEVKPLEIAEFLPPEETVFPPSDANSLLEEIDLLAMLPKDEEIDIKPGAVDPEYALSVSKPAMEGDPAATALDISGPEITADLPEFGREIESLPPAEAGQITVDPGSIQADSLDLGKFTDDLIKKGANGKVENGALDGITSLEDLIDLPPNVLLSKKTLLPSDLLFEFNRAELRESARLGLMKLGLLIDRNPGLYCWIEGHTDLVGSDETNLELSRKRAEAVKTYLVKSMQMDPSRIITRGFGRSQPLVSTGTVDEQAGNRRVEIRMRKTPPTDEPITITPKKAPVIEEAPPIREAAPVVETRPVQEAPPPPKPILVKPKRAIPVIEEPAPAPPPKAMTIDEPAPAPRAMSVEPDPAPPAIPRAEAVEE